MGPSRRWARARRASASMRTNRDGVWVVKQVDANREGHVGPRTHVSEARHGAPVHHFVSFDMTRG